MKKVNLIVTGGIAASKSYELYQLLKEKYEVSVILTKNAFRFAKFENTKISSKIFDQEFYDSHSTGEHISKTYDSDFNIIYPATYNYIGKIASGICDDLASLIFAASNTKTWIFPSMNSRMYLNPIFQNNRETLQKLNHISWIEPKEGRLASGEYGIGRALEPKEVLTTIEKNYYNKFSKIKDKKFLINFGRTRTYLDKIRYLTNESSGKMGLEILKVLESNLINSQAVVGDCDFSLPNNYSYQKVKTNYEMLEAMKNNFKSAEVVICAAALNDFEFTNTSDKKIEKRSIDLKNYKIDLKGSVDVLRELGRIKTNQFLVGFSLANDFNLEKSWEKIHEKNLDALILNLTTAMSNSETEIKILITKTKKVIDFKLMSKVEAAFEIVKTLNEIM
ncbi:bifunctional phosphopantothenoylcysteine decarboxylase/phosphopantothenate--cysteine ligase CoaBC [Spiroplasma alleghenense]|uniref:Coenzyme A biosynthesis bifunctional protein CoaBC n=1 Tax=Spiroplasma alleghenense TaxID=216931 RepID=A0A345Z3M1_9MOLU|nr:bifunctional phosphopantothenoylcysteine decarboxylase/phosphopantothenate--cysteine ligase CoaBC [Spiroplasma alleghenense]AXK51200.1 pantothenate metabolism flavoprotein [Spiroplasma alleghenense]